MPNIMRVFGIALLFSMIACGASTPSTSPPSAETPDEERGYDPPATETDTSTAEPETIDVPTPDPKTPDSTPVATSVKVRWNAIGKYIYSLDVKTPKGEWVGPCLDVSILGAANSVTYKGVCTSAGEKAVPKPAAYRLYFSRSDTDQHWQDFVEVTPTSDTADVVFDLPTTAPSAVDLKWKERSITADYSLDVFLMNGEQIRPCINAATLGKSKSLVFDGNCTAGPNPRRVDLKDVKDFVICSAENSDWDHAVCKGVPYSGLGTSRTIAE